MFVCLLSRLFFFMGWHFCFLYGDGMGNVKGGVTELRIK